MRRAREGGYISRFKVGGRGGEEEGEGEGRGMKVSYFCLSTIPLFFVTMIKSIWSI